MDETRAIGTSEDADQTAEATFDERGFLKRVRRRSVLRTVGVSTAVLVLLLLAVVAGGMRWYGAILTQANRIDGYYPDLVAISHPNTRVMGPSVTRWHFPGASNDYASFRSVGARPVPAGVRSVDFDLWSAEFLRGYDERWTMQAGRNFSGSDLVPELRFLYPAPDDVRKGPNADFRPEAERGFAQETSAAVLRLRATPASYTVEVAFSFDRLLVLDELRSFTGTGTTLAWGAVNVWNAEDAPLAPPEQPGHMIGVPFSTPERVFGIASDSPRQAEEQLLDVLENVSASAMTGTADKARASAEFIGKNGTRYYGVVLTGSPSEMLRLAKDERVTGVSYGLSVAPWE